MSKYWPAKVIDNNDPDQKGKVQIYIEPLMVDLTPETYPWANADRNFSSFIPEIDDMVWVYFENEERWRNPFYCNKISYESYNEHNQTIGSLTGAYPNIKYIKLKNGVSIGLNSNETEASILVGSAEIFINSSGEIHIKGSEGTLEFSVLGETLKAWLEAHTHPTGVGPSGPPTQASQLSTILSKKVKNN